MIWHLILKKQEQDLHEFHIRTFYRNANLYLLNTLFGYLMSTLLFFNLMPWMYHLGFFVCWLMFITLIYVHAKKMRKMGVLSAPKQSLLFILLSFLIWTMLWNGYFYFVSRAASQSEFMKMILLQIILLVVNIAIVGLFERLITAMTVFTAAHISISIWIIDREIFQNLFIPSYLMVTYFIIFLRIYNKHVIKLFRVKEQNSQLFDALRQKNAFLEQSNQAQSRYLSAASHDLRQPLHALALLTSDAQRRNTVPEVAATLSKIEQAIDSLSQSFNSMLNLSRLDAGVVKPEFKNVCLQRVFERLQVEFEEVALQKSLRLVMMPTKVWVWSDEGMLHSILSNFISNALRYTERGSVVLGVRRGSGGTARVLVFDTGSGVPAEKAQQIFQEYKRLEDAEQRVKGGVGLGLAISERMARLLGTQLLVESTMGKGSCFGLRLSTVPSPELETEITAAREQISDALYGKRVAILDDDETAIEYLSELLSNWNMEVSVILSSAMLAEVIQDEGPFDLVLSDYHLGMHDENGLDVLIAAQSLQPECPPKCILLTGDTSAQLTQTAQAKNVEVLYKPLRPVRLRSHLNGLLQG